MARLAVALLIVALVALACVAVAAALRPVESAARRGAESIRRGPDMPGSFRNVAFLLLFVLLIGVASGWVGAP